MILIIAAKSNQSSFIKPIKKSKIVLFSVFCIINNEKNAVDWIYFNIKNFSIAVFDSIILNSSTNTWLHLWNKHVKKKFTNMVDHMIRSCDSQTIWSPTNQVHLWSFYYLYSRLRKANCSES